MGPRNTHTCREPPMEATIYSLSAEGGKLDQFSATSKAELTLEGEDSFRQKKNAHYSLELPVQFSRTDVSVEHDDLSHIEEVEG